MENNNNQGAISKEVMLPSPVLQFHDTNNTAPHVEDTNKHQGRTRSFPHERGIWASYVFIDYSDADGWIELQNECKTLLNTTATLDFVAIERMHLSLTKTFTIRHHNISPFVENLREQLVGHRRFRLEFSGLEVYVNEERTRTFVGVRVAEESYSPLNELVASVDECLAEYKLPLFYVDRSFHVSILWCLGDRESEVRKELPAISTMFERVYEEEYCDISQQVKKLWFKCGNKMFNFDLI
ncbi:U6 snRNA phosphodiesterase 1 [Anopheles moucheti]|uniref:U6 snRNA phosphodiesterase 1 n=1 Tax=Anopheles moucheti TaxID=186751 RepID=UPI0022F09F1B|nr:U6 snRNA phosphodiesterase 1 [Anopheles moucheti]